MRLKQLKAFLYDYQQQEKGHDRKPPANRSDLAMRALESFVDSLIAAKRRDHEIIYFDDFLLFLKSYQSNEPLSDHFDKSESGTQYPEFFKAWSREPSPELTIADNTAQTDASKTGEKTTNNSTPPPLPPFQQKRNDTTVNRHNAPEALSAREMFLGRNVPPVNYYRLAVFNRLLEKNGRVSLTHHFYEKDTILDVAELPRQVTRAVGNNEFYCEVPMLVTGDFQPLPSLTPFEKITALSAEAELEYIGPPSNTGCSYIRTKNGSSLGVTLKYNIQQQQNIERLNRNRVMPTTPAAEKFIRSIRFSAEIKRIQRPTGVTEEDLIGAIINLLRDFRPADKQNRKLANALLNADDDYTVFNLRLDHLVGVCCDRAILFMMFADRLDLIAQYISNDVHDYIEYQTLQSSTRYPVCLGGGTADLTIEKLPHETTPDYLMDFSVFKNPTSLGDLVKSFDDARRIIINRNSDAIRGADNPKNQALLHRLFGTETPRNSQQIKIINDKLATQSKKKK